MWMGERIKQHGVKEHQHQNGMKASHCEQRVLHSRQLADIVKALPTFLLGCYSKSIVIINSDMEGLMSLGNVMILSF
jgi:hypothetical protein